MLHNEITSEREREIFKVNYAVVVVAFYCQTHTICVLSEGVRVERDAFIVLDNRRGHSQRMNACSRQKIIHL